MEFDYQVLRLSEYFYNDYDNDQYPEMMLKNSRAYNCLLIDLHYDYFLCIPFRTEVRHRNAYRFKKSKRSRNHQSGLDYSKILIICDLEYLESEDAIVDSDEYHEMVENITRIARQADRYV